MKEKLLTVVTFLFLAIAQSSIANAQVIPKTDVYAVDTATAISVPAGGYNNSKVLCNSATHQVLSGGCWNASYSTKNYIAQSYPVPTGSTSTQDGYFCEWHNVTTAAVNARARAMCLIQ
jgi:hypothetical protein